MSSSPGVINEYVNIRTLNIAYLVSSSLIIVISVFYRKLRVRQCPKINDRINTVAGQDASRGHLPTWAILLFDRGRGWPPAGLVSPDVQEGMCGYCKLNNFLIIFMSYSALVWRC